MPVYLIIGVMSDDDVVVGFATVLLDDWIGTGGVTRAWTSSQDMMYSSGLVA